MVRVVANMSVSLDGFAADSTGGVSEVFSRHTKRAVPVLMPGGSEAPFPGP